MIQLSLIPSLEGLTTKGDIKMLLNIYFLICIVWGILSICLNKRFNGYDVRISHQTLVFLVNAFFGPLLIAIWLVKGIVKGRLKISLREMDGLPVVYICD